MPDHLKNRPSFVSLEQLLKVVVKIVFFAFHSVIFKDAQNLRYF